ncbi:hypothetical protein ACQEVB_25300 [Pseudonocardia sp. CA-107938]|uniref:hypothetical protein n=1 Tax=Pseudonocardia sp. CA-107938 TaxID=3240021 RepID=UPI003D92A4E1
MAADVDVTSNARKHGITVAEMRAVLGAPLRSIEQDGTVLHIGVTADQDLLEVVVAPGEPVTVLHAMRLRPFNYRHLRAG